MVDPASTHPVVSVVSITFNQQDFIRETLAGFVAQQADFPVEVIVADDASTDATPMIIQEFHDRYPELFRPILRSRNIGIHANLTDALCAARGKYLALCEGDDFWTDPLKLSKQVAFLEDHPQSALCFHPVRVMWEDGGQGASEFPPVGLRRDLSLSALISRNFIQTNSVLYRRLERYDDIPPDVLPLDWYLHIRHALSGEISMLPEAMAVYRRHRGGIWWSDREANPAKFWVERGQGYAALWEAVLDLFPDDPATEEILAGNAAWLLRTISTYPGQDGRDALISLIGRYPRFTMLALQHHWNRTAWQSLRELGHGYLAAKFRNLSPRGWRWSSSRP